MLVAVVAVVGISIISDISQSRVVRSLGRNVG